MVIVAAALIVALTTAPAAWPNSAENEFVLTLNSCTASTLGCSAMPFRPIAPAVTVVLLSTPSSSTSFEEKRPPPAMNGRLVPMPVTGVVFPASRPSANGFRPFSGSSRIFLFSITCPSEEVSASSSGVDSVTCTVSTTSPGVSVTRTVAFWSTCKVKRSIVERLNDCA